MRIALICPLIAIVTLIFCSCENRYRNRATVNNNSSTDSDLKKSSTLEAQKRGLAKDAYQVTAAEYDQFFSYRYGLLYQKFSDEPFNGRIVTIENGDKGDFVSQDEAWKNGRKHGVSSRWFSNGIKMYERNYDEGKWHGTVTRWWPNGQKMYVRAYTQGKRVGKEATWRSDGTPIDRSGIGAPSTSTEFGNSTNSGDGDLPSISIPSSSETTVEAFPIVPTAVSEPVASPAEPVISSPTVEPQMPDEAPVFEPLALPGDSVTEPPAFEPIGDAGLPPLTEDTPSSDLPDLPAFPDADMKQDSIAEGLPPLSTDGLSESGDLPSVPADSDLPSEDLPPLPGASDLPPPPADGLPPLPGADTGGLPPLSGDPGGLPPLPEGGGLPPLPGDPGDLPPLPDDGGLPPLPDDGGLPPLPELP